MRPTHLRANYLNTPYVDTHPYLSWELHADADAAEKIQTAYRIICHGGPAHTDPFLLWDSGKVESTETLSILYEGSLVAKTRVTWNVTVWDEDDVATTAESTFFEVALISEADWGGAVWMSREVVEEMPEDECAHYRANPTPIFNHTFTSSNQDVRRAQLYLAVLGYADVILNGVRLSASQGEKSSILDAPFSDFSTRVFYNVYEVHHLLLTAPGSVNVLTVEVGNGWWKLLPLRFWGRLNLRETMPHGVPAMRSLLETTYMDGNVQVDVSSVLTSAGWAVRNSTTVFNDIFLGTVENELTAREVPVYSLPVQAQHKIGKLQVSNIPPIVKFDNILADQMLLNDVHNLTAEVVESDLSEFLGARLENERREKNLVFDARRNHAGSCHFKVEWEANTPVGSAFRIRAKYGEILHSNGSVNVMTSVAGQIKSPLPTAACQPAVAYQRDEFVLKRKTTESIVSWEPKFVWHGMRYIEVDVYGNFTTPTVRNISIVCTPMRTELDRALTYATSDPRLNAVLEASRNTFHSNLMSVQSDCPHRERFGYGGDTLASGESFIARYDMSSFYAKRVWDFVDAQRENGGYTETAPHVGISDAGLGGGAGPIGWAAFVPEAVMWMYKYYGNRALMAETYPSVLRFANLLAEVDVKGGLGDWMPLEPTNPELTGMNFLFTTYVHVANISRILRDDANCLHFTAKAEEVRARINSEYLNNATASYNNLNTTPDAKWTSLDRPGFISGYYGGAGGRLTHAQFNATQTGQALALYNNIAPEEMREQVFDVLLQNVRSAEDVTYPFPTSNFSHGGKGSHLLTGMFGVKWVLGALSEFGHVDEAHAVVTQDTYPSLYWMTDNHISNATTVWEAWFHSDGKYSHNHPMFASADTWFVQHVLGIMPHPNAEGYDSILLRPRPLLRLATQSPIKTASASGTYTSIRGPISMSWEVSANGKAVFEFQIPPNTRADVFLPNMDPFAVGSGTHSYTSKM